MKKAFLVRPSPTPLSHTEHQRKMPSNDKTYVLGAGGLTGYEIVDVLRRNEKDVVAVVRVS